MENRRAFFKGLAAFASGVVGAKVAPYIPKKEEPKEELLVSSYITIEHEGKKYHPLVVKKTDLDRMERVEDNKIGDLSIPAYKPTFRKANI